MKPLFADTSFYLALLNYHDLAHARALEAANYFHRRVVLTDFILLELGNALCDLKQRGLFIELVGRISSDSNIRILAASRTLLDQGLQFYSQRKDKQWSLTDCISFVVMSEEGLTEALTTDHHFEQAGFTALLR